MGVSTQIYELARTLTDRENPVDPEWAEVLIRKLVVEALRNAEPRFTAQLAESYNISIHELHKRLKDER